MEHYYVVGSDCVAVYFDYIGTVFLGIFLADGVGGQFSGFAAWHEAGSEFECKNGASDEASRFYTYDFGHTFVAVKL